MKLRFVNKKLNRNEFVLDRTARVVEEKVEEKPVADVVKNKKPNKKKTNMDLKEKMAAAEEVMNSIAPEVKVVKKDRGLIERTESSKIILTEDNRQVLND